MHTATHNFLVAEGTISPVIIYRSDGKPIKADSMWAATGWLKANGYYDDPTKSHSIETI